MKDFKDAKSIIDKLSDQLTEERLAEVRSVSGVGYLPAGSLTELMKDQPFSVEDIVTILMSGWILQTEEIKLQAERIAELEETCTQQSKSIDDIADQTSRLRRLLGPFLQDQDRVSSLDMLKAIAQRPN